jgi:phosphoglycerol transferase MdoB-like AlkP superfamily enzyme
MVGGAIEKPQRIDTYASQIDIAATLLYQLNIDHKDFVFSKNILNPASPHFGFFAFKDGFGMVSPENEYVFDNESNAVTTNTKQVNYNQKNAEAYLQKLFDYLGSL